MIKKLAKAIVNKDNFAITIIYNQMLNLGYTDNMIIEALRSEGYIKDDN